MQATIQKWGNSQGVRIPKTLLDAMHWTTNESIAMRAEDDRIVIERVRHRKTIEALFAGYDGAYSGQEVDWGGPVGDEVW